MQSKIYCPKCGGELKILHTYDLDWNQPGTTFYPSCPLCSWTTFKTFNSKELVIDFFKTYFPKRVV